MRSSSRCHGSWNDILSCSRHAIDQCLRCVVCQEIIIRSVILILCNRILEPVFDRFSIKPRVALAQDLPVPIHKRSRLLLLSQAPEPCSQPVHELANADLLLIGLQHLGSLLITLLHDHANQLVTILLCVLDGFDLVILGIHERSILPGVILSTRSAQELDPLSLAVRDVLNDEQQTSLFIHDVIGDVEVLSTSSNGSGHSHSPCPARLTSSAYSLHGLCCHLD
mmetsp:Transcript_50387/g.119808  ORF Transcript_50387/g.119808 Transcript_50387/m.119808 type:complete len:224 (-) Transcript_50387:3695-4366(-)